MQILKSGLIAILMCAGAAYAYTPVPGWYAGIIGGGSRGAGVDFALTTSFFDSSKLVALLENKTALGDTHQAVLSYSLLGDVGGQIGFRMNHFRVEAEAFYNNNAFSHLAVDGFNIPNANSGVSNTQQLSKKLFTPPGLLTFDGYTNTYAVMLNGLYDIYLLTYTDKFVPYVGAGVGWEHLQNEINLYIDGTLPSNGKITFSENAVAVQAIAGISYYLTDYTSFSLDYRYFTATQAITGSTQMASFNNRPQLYSVNLLFNSAFNLG